MKQFRNWWFDINRMERSRYTMIEYLKIYTIILIGPIMVALAMLGVFE